MKSDGFSEARQRCKYAHQADSLTSALTTIILCTRIQPLKEKTQNTTSHTHLPPKLLPLSFEPHSQPLTTEFHLNQTDFPKLKKCFCNVGLKYYKLNAHL